MLAAIVPARNPGQAGPGVAVRRCSYVTELGLTTGSDPVQGPGPAQAEAVEVDLPGIACGRTPSAAPKGAKLSPQSGREGILSLNQGLNAAGEKNPGHQVRLGK